MSVVAHALKRLFARRVETWQQEVAGGDQFQLTTLISHFSRRISTRRSESFAHECRPIERHAASTFRPAGGSVSCRNIEMPMIYRRRFSSLNTVGERLFHLRKDKIIVTGLRPRGRLPPPLEAVRSSAVFFQFQRAVRPSYGLPIRYRSTVPIGASSRSVHHFAHATFEFVGV